MRQFLRSARVTIGVGEKAIAGGAEECLHGIAIDTAAVEQAQEHVLGHRVVVLSRGLGVEVPGDAELSPAIEERLVITFG